MATALPPAKILSIDDEYMLRRTLVAYLEDSGYKLLEAENGKQGLAVFRQEKPDLVLTDLQMPEMGGLEVLKTITKEAPETPVIVISGAGGMNDVIEALRYGAWDYLTKPITDLAVLEHTVSKCLERARLIAENVAYRAELEKTNQALKKSLGILEEDQEAGRSVQQRLLPESNLNLGGVLFQHRVVPSLFLSGDFVDYFALGEDKCGFYLADVSGHGASSAFITILLKSLISQWVSQYQVGQESLIAEPEKVLSRLSQEIYASKLGKYLTMVYGVLDKTQKQLIYSIGGHYPNPVLMREGKAEFVEGKGFPVGIMPTVVYQRYDLALADDNKFLIFSDGVMEVLAELNMEAKEERLLTLVQEGDGSVDYLSKILSLDEKRDRPDDLTCLSLRYEPMGGATSAT